MDPNWLSTLLSIAGVNRPIGAGDVVRYQTQTDSPNARDTQVAQPGPSSPGAAFDPNSALANLSIMTPAYNAALAASQAAAIPSGTATATAQPFPGATPGPSSADVTASQAQVGSVPIAGAPGTGLALQTSPAPSAPAPIVTAPVVSPGGGDAGTASGAGVGEGTGEAGAAAGNAAGGPGAPGTPGGADGSGAGEGEGGGTAGDGPGGAGGTGGDGPAGDYAKGGFVKQGKPNSTKDDVSAKLQHGEFVIPREAVLHLAATAPAVLQHVMHVSAMHALANKPRAAQPSPGAMLTGQNGGLPPRPTQPQGYRSGGLVIPAGAGPHISPAAVDAIRRAIAMHMAAPRPMTAGPAQMAQMGPAMASQGRPPVLPPLAPRETNV